MITRGASLGRTAYRYRLRGLGQIPADTAGLVANPQYSTQQNVGAQPTTTYTLDSYMAEWAAASIAFPSALAGADPMSEAVAVAQSYCATEHVNDCGNLSAIAAKYGAQVKAALATSPPPASQPTCGTGMVWDGAACKPAAGGTAYSPSGSASRPPSPGPGYVWDGTAWRAPATTATNGSQSSTGGPVVVNPSPASQSTTDGSSLTSAASVASLANGATLQTGATTSTDLIPGIPDAALWIGGGALVLILFAMRK